MIKILVVDDSPVARELLADWFAAEKDFKVAGLAKDGLEGFEMCKALAPDIVIMDIMMPKMNGLEATEKIMAFCPTPVLVFSSVLNDRGTNIVFEAISRGALDCLAKPEQLNDGAKSVRSELVKKVRLLHGVPVIRHPLGRFKARREEAEAGRERAGKAPARPGQFAVLGIGASTGGPKALAEILRFFPGNFPAPILVVQHIADQFVEGLARWLSSLSKLKVKVASAGETIAPGTVYLAPSDKHMLVKNGKIEFGDQGPVNNCRPAVDVLFNSLAREYGARAAAVLLTGMGADGARGMEAVHEKGGRTLVQDQKSSVVFGMPGSAIELGAVDEIAPLVKIPGKIFDLFGLNRKEDKDK